MKQEKTVKEEKKTKLSLMNRLNLNDLLAFLVRGFKNKIKLNVQSESFSLLLVHFFIDRVCKRDLRARMMRKP